jgi:Na+/proline symporter
MSACSNFMVNIGALFTKNLFRKYFRPDATDRDLLWTGRYSGLALAFLAVLFALSIKNVLHAFLFTETLAAFMGIMFLGGLIWKRANRYGAGAAVLSSLIVYYLANYFYSGNLQLVYVWKPAPFGFAMFAGFLMFWLVSVLTPPEDKEKIELFFDNMRRKSDSASTDALGRKPLGSETGEDLLLLDLPGWRRKERWQNFFKRYREDLVGFLISWIVVGLLIFLAWAILQI